MTNREKYSKELLDIALNGVCIAIKNDKPIACSEIQCKDCDLNSSYKKCGGRLQEWANSEYNDIRDKMFWLSRKLEALFDCKVEYQFDYMRCSVELKISKTGFMNFSMTLLDEHLKRETRSALFKQISKCYIDAIL